MIKSFLRGFFASFLLLSMMASASAQTKTWGHSLYQGVGLSNKLNDEDKQTVALRIGYAVSYTITPRWAVTQGVALRLKGFGKDCYFAGNCSSTYIDLPLLLQYHFNKEWKNGIVAECGPVVSFLAKGGKYGGRTEDNVVNGEKEYRNFDLGLQPALYYETKNWRFGVQAHVGLLDTKCKYRIPYDWIHNFGQYHDERYDDPRLTSRYYAFDIVATICYHW